MILSMISPFTFYLHLLLFWIYLGSDFVMASVKASPGNIYSNYTVICIFVTLDLALHLILHYFYIYIIFTCSFTLFLHLHLHFFHFHLYVLQCFYIIVSFNVSITFSFTLFFSFVFTLFLHFFTWSCIIVNHTFLCVCVFFIDFHSISGPSGRKYTK